jgi:hypothetical protein
MWESHGQIPGTGYFKRMARVPIGLKVSKADAARIDEVLARPEFAGWTRADWCLEIIRSALRYYVGNGPAPDTGQAPVREQPAAAQPAAPGQQPPVPTAASAPVPAAGATAEPGAAGPAAGTPATGEPAAGEAGAAGDALPAAPEPASQLECSHPPEARNYETGACAICGAILWD